MLGAYQSTIQHQQFQLQNEVELSGFLSKCAEHVVWHRIVLAVVLQQDRRSSSSQSSVMVERIDVSVHCNLEKTHSDLDVVTGSVPKVVSSRQSVMVWELDAAATAECCHIAVYRRCSTADAVADATEYTRCKNFLDDWGRGGHHLL